MSSPYTVETGDGYQGIASVSRARCLINLGHTAARDWPVGMTVTLYDHPLGIAARPGAESGIETRTITNDGDGNILGVTSGALDRIGTGDRPSDVRVYDLAEHDDQGREGLLLVDADTDPTVGGGQ